MGKLRVLSGKEVCAILAKHGFIEVRRRGSHIVMQKKLHQGDRLGDCLEVFEDMMQDKINEARRVFRLTDPDLYRIKLVKLLFRPPGV